MGIRDGEEWIIFGKKEKDAIGITACDRNVLYKWRDKARNSQDNGDLLEILRKLYGHTGMSSRKETRKLFFSNGKVELEETYINGKLNGERTLWYPNGRLYGKEFYINDTLDGKAEWFYSTGQIRERKYYAMGMEHQVTRVYHDTSLYSAYTRIGRIRHKAGTVREHVKVDAETVFDSQGRIIIDRLYSYDGNLYEEHFYGTGGNLNTHIHYHENGTIFSLSYYSEHGRAGTHSTYDTTGRIVESHKYD